jgi:hypothetical protein
MNCRQVERMTCHASHRWGDAHAYLRAFSLTGRWFPQFDLVPLGIHDPGKLAVLGFIDPVEDVAAFRLERCDQSLKIFGAVDL